MIDFSSLWTFQGKPTFSDIFIPPSFPVYTDLITASLAQLWSVVSELVLYAWCPAIISCATTTLLKAWMFADKFRGNRFNLMFVRVGFQANIPCASLSRISIFMSLVTLRTFTVFSYTSLWNVSHIQLVWIIEDGLWEEAGELMLAVSRDEMEDVGEGVCDPSSFQRMCKTALFAGNSAMPIKFCVAKLWVFILYREFTFKFKFFSQFILQLLYRFRGISQLDSPDEFWVYVYLQ